MVFTNKELSEKLEINFAKWKRWSREFVPVNIEKGYLRYYSYDEAFKVFLGGHLVAGMGYSMPEAKQILADLDQWLLEWGFYSASEDSPRRYKGKVKVLGWEIHIAPEKNYGFHYLAKGYLSDSEVIDYEGVKAIREIYIDDPILMEQRHEQVFNESQTKVLNLSRLQGYFRVKI